MFPLSHGVKRTRALLERLGVLNLKKNKPYCTQDEPLLSLGMKDCPGQIFDLLKHLAY